MLLRENLEIQRFPFSPSSVISVSDNFWSPYGDWRWGRGKSLAEAHGQTGVGNEDTRRPKLASGKNWHVITHPYHRGGSKYGDYAARLKWWQERLYIAGFAQHTICI